eukprot:364246-Chlamydomonas_euryale.AAC.11
MTLLQQGTLLLHHSCHFTLAPETDACMLARRLGHQGLTRACTRHAPGVNAKWHAHMHTTSSQATTLLFSSGCSCLPSINPLSSPPVTQPRTPPLALMSAHLVHAGTHALGEVEVVVRARVGAALNHPLVHDAVELVRRHARAHCCGRKVEHLAACAGRRPDALERLAAVDRHCHLCTRRLLLGWVAILVVVVGLGDRVGDLHSGVLPAGSAAEA